jgi:hypothetical protein
MAKGHSSAVIVLSHFEIAWFSIDRAAAHCVPLDLSARPFCPCAFTPLKLRRLVFVVNGILECFGAKGSVARVI